MKTIKLLLLIPALAFLTAGIAQDDPRDEVALLGRSYGDRITLRYFATTPALFNSANKVGYVIERAEWKDKTPFAQLSYQPLKGSPFTRWEESRWETAVKKLAPADSNELKLAGLAMGFSEPGQGGAKTDVLANDLESLKTQQEEADNRFAFITLATSRSKLAAEGLALRVDDKEVQKGKRYVYRVRINQAPANGKGSWTYLDIQCKEFTQSLQVPDSSVRVNEDDRMISFTFPESKEYFAFNIERSDDGGSSFRRLTDMPSFKLKPRGYEGPTDYGFVDSGLVNYKQYVYRILVSTPFADEVLLKRFTAVPRDRTPPPSPFLKSAEHTKPREIELNWETTGETPGDLKGFMISRSNDEKTGYQRITTTVLAPGTRKYVDNSFVADGLNYYVVEAIDTAGNIGRSFPAYVTLIDSTPPAIPQVATAIIDSLGKVIITMKPNKERDFMGYQLLKANAADHEFSVIEETYRDSLGSSTFVLYDSTTLQTLTRNIYYQLIAFDTHFNQSDPSRIIELARRDTIPPVSPLVTDYLANDSSVVIHFANSASEDVARNILMRRIAGTAKYDSIFYNRDTSVTHFTDQKVKAGTQYEYAMIAFDQSGLRSKTSNVLVLKTPPETRMPAPVITVAGDKEKATATIRVALDAKLDAAKLKAEIFRKTGNNGWVLVKTIETAKGNSFTDTGVPKGATVTYVVRLVDAKGKYSTFSNEVPLSF